MSLKRLTKESLVYGLSRYIGKFISVFLLPLYTSVLSPEDYGIMDLLSTIIVVSTFLIVSGTDTAVGYYYFRKEYAAERPVIIVSSFYLRLIFSFAVFVVIFFISPFISKTLLGRDLSLFVIITGVTIIFQSVHSFIFDLLRLEFRPWLFTILSTLSILINILLTIVYVLIFRLGVYGALTAQAIAYGMIFVFTIFYVFKKYHFTYSVEWIKKILSYGFPLIGTGIAVWVLNSTDRYFLAHFSNLNSVGIYAVGMKLASFLGLIAGALQLAWGPFALDIQYEENAKRVYSRVFLIYFIINTIGVFLVSLFSIDILKVFTQPDYYSALAVVPFLCFSVVFSSGYFIVAIGLNITKKLQHTIWITILGAVLNIILNLILTPHYGAIAAAFSIMLSNLAILVLTLILSQKYYPVSYDYSKIIYLLSPAVLIIGFCYYFNFNLFIRIILSIIYLIFSAGYLYFKYRNSPEIKQVIQKIRNPRTSLKRQPETTNLDI